MHCCKQKLFKTTTVSVCKHQWLKRPWKPQTRTWRHRHRQYLWRNRGARNNSSALADTNIRRYITGNSHLNLFCHYGNQFSLIFRSVAALNDNTAPGAAQLKYCSIERTTLASWPSWERTKARPSLYMHFIFAACGVRRATDPALNMWRQRVRWLRYVTWPDWNRTRTNLRQQWRSVQKHRVAIASDRNRVYDVSLTFFRHTIKTETALEQRQNAL